MKEAQKLGADAVVNVKIDVFEDNKSSKFLGIKMQKERVYIYKASALAIKYTEAIDSGVKK